MARSPETRFKLILHHAADHSIRRTLIYSGSHVKICMKMKATVRLSLNFHAESRSQVRSLPREARVRHWRFETGWMIAVSTHPVLEHDPQVERVPVLLGVLKKVVG